MLRPMSITFEILKKSERSHARVGLLKTPHGVVETPAFIPVATRGSLRTLDSFEMKSLGSQMIISNTFHLHITPGEDIVAKGGGLHTYAQWNGPIMTDSGGFQVFSFGFGRDHGMGKMLQEESEKTLKDGAHPAGLKMTEEGVTFKSPVNGDTLFLSPEVSIAIQEKIGADIMFAFDECPSPLATAAYMRTSIDRTHRWAQRCIDAKKTDQALYGIVQGGAFPELREESARIIGAMDFAGFGIGGEFGYDKMSLERTTALATQALPQGKPRHLLGVGHPEDFEYIARAGADTFDCIAPTHYARHGTAFTSVGRVDLRKRERLNEFEPLDPQCKCPVCQTYTRSFISHLIRAHEHSGMKLATMHNVFYLNALAAKVRQDIKDGKL
ncbi:MAG: queuine tRNA-ribosyltransferase, queuine tRNA-ribosyltransferase [Candidatus Parcubacteria bacterium]|jgi:tRNA-guanine family transglycosylase